MSTMARTRAERASRNSVQALAASTHCRRSNSRSPFLGGSLLVRHGGEVVDDEGYHAAGQDSGWCLSVTGSDVRVLAALHGSLMN